MNLIILQQEEIDASQCAVLSDYRATHILNVLKPSLGDTLRIGVLNGPKGLACIQELGPQKVLIKCELESIPPPRPKIDLILAMPRPKVMARLWSRLAALGVNRIVILRAKRVENSYFSSRVLDKDFYTKRLISGIEQARCTQLPEVYVRKRFRPFVEEELASLFSDKEMRILSDPSGEIQINKLLADNASETGKAVLAIGPEGGWNSFELDSLQRKGFNLACLGNRILQTDTACIGLLCVISQYLRP